MGANGKGARRRVRYLVLVLAGFFIQQNMMVAGAQDARSQEAGPPGTTTTNKPGAADGTWSPALTGARRPLYRLRTSDVVEITFPFSPDYNQLVTVQPDGYIPLKSVRQQYAEGLSLPELQSAIGQAYTGVLHEPEVTLVLKDFDKPYFIAAGEVGHPGKYELRSDTTAAEAVAIAGGFTPRAKHSQVVLFRRISDQTIESHLLNVKSMLNARELNEDAHLQSGDLLWVPQNLLSKIRQFMPASSLSLYANPTGF